MQTSYNVTRCRYIPPSCLAPGLPAVRLGLENSSVDYLETIYTS
jgi:hypothetical protein